MANLTVPAPTQYLTDNAFSGTLLPAAEANALTGFTGFQFTNSPEGLVVARVTVGSAGACTLTITTNSGTKTVTLANSTTWISGVFDPAVYSNSAGIVQVAMSVVTGNAVGLYLVPASVALAGERALHDPFNMTPGAETR